MLRHEKVIVRVRRPLERGKHGLAGIVAEANVGQQIVDAEHQPQQKHEREQAPFQPNQPWIFVTHALTHTRARMVSAVRARAQRFRQGRAGLWDSTRNKGAEPVGIRNSRPTSRAAVEHLPRLTSSNSPCCKAFS